MGIFEENKKEIIYNLINCGIAAGLVFFGAFSAISWDFSKINWQMICAALGAGIVAFLIKFSQYWESEKGEYSKKGQGKIGGSLISFF